MEAPGAPDETGTVDDKLTLPESDCPAFRKRRPEAVERPPAYDYARDDETYGCRQERRRECESKQIGAAAEPVQRKIERHRDALASTGRAYKPFGQQGVFPPCHSVIVEQVRVEHEDQRMEVIHTVEIKSVLIY